jgi:hypothetical protein
LNEEQIFYKSWSLTNAVYAYYAFNYKVNLGAFTSLEYHTNEFGIDDSADSSFSFYPKGGVYASLNF